MNDRELDSCFWAIFAVVMAGLMAAQWVLW